MARLHANYANSGGSAIKCAMCNSSSSGLHKYLHVAVLPLTYRATFAYFNYKWRSSSGGGTSSRAFVIFITSQASHPSNLPTYPRRSCILSRSSMSRAMSLCLCKDLRCQATHSTRPYIPPHFIYTYTPVIYLCCDFDGFWVRAFWLGRSARFAKDILPEVLSSRRVYDFRSYHTIISFSFQFSI